MKVKYELDCSLAGARRNQAGEIPRKRADRRSIRRQREVDAPPPTPDTLRRRSRTEGRDPGFGWPAFAVRTRRRAPGSQPGVLPRGLDVRAETPRTDGSDRRGQPPGPRRPALTYPRARLERRKRAARSPRPAGGRPSWRASALP